MQGEVHDRYEGKKYCDIDSVLDLALAIFDVSSIFLTPSSLLALV